MCTTSISHYLIHCDNHWNMSTDIFLLHPWHVHCRSLIPLLTGNLHFSSMHRKIRIKQTTTISAPDPEAQSKAMVFFVGEATSTDNFRETYKDYRKKISARLDYLEQLNSKRDYGYLPLIIDRIRGRTTALKKLIDDSRVSLDESTEQIEKVREKERQVWERKRQKSS